MPNRAPPDADTIDSALDVLHAYQYGAKAGRTHSADTLDAVRAIISMLEQTFGLGDEDDADTQDEEAAATA